MMGRRKRDTIRLIREAVRDSRLEEPFSASQVAAATGIELTTISTFLPKHRVGNPGGKTELFIRWSKDPPRYCLRRLLGGTG